MGLLHFYGQKNQVTSQALAVSYTSQIKKRGAYGDLYEYHRIASKSYSFVGMDERTARACRDAKEAQYTRTFRQYRSETGALLDTQLHLCVASVQMAHDDGGMWHVDITVAEDQVQFVYGWELNIVGQLFDTSLDYDEPAEVPGMFLQIDRLERGATVMTGFYRADAPGFDRLSNDFKVMRSDDGKSWTEDAAAVKTAEGQFTVATAGAGKLYMLTWKGERSNVIADPSAGWDYTGTLGPLVFFNGMFWRAAYSFDVPNFDRTKLIVYIQRSTDSSWKDVTLDCEIRSGMIYFSNMTSATSVFKAKLYYSGDGGIATNEQQTPYNPDADVGDGSLLVTGCFEESPAGSMRYDLNCLWKTSGEINPSAKMSSDGAAWSVVSTTYNDNNLVVRLNTQDYPTYLKVFNGGVQASNVLVLPFRGAEGEQIWCKGISAFTIGMNNIQVSWGTNIANFERENLLLQVSTDGGVTWSDATAERLEGEDFIDSGIQVDDTHRLFRFCYDAVAEADRIYSAPIKYPMA